MLNHDRFIKCVSMASMLASQFETEYNSTVDAEM